MNFGLKSVYKGLSTSDVGVPVLEATRLFYLLSMQLPIPTFSHLVRPLVKIRNDLKDMYKV